MKKNIGILLIFIGSLSVANDGQGDIPITKLQPVPVQKTVAPVPVAREVKMVTLLQIPVNKWPSTWEIVKAVKEQYPRGFWLSIPIVFPFLVYYTKFPNPETDNSDSNNIISETKIVKI